MDMFDFRERAGSQVDAAVEELATRAIGAAIEVHGHLGPGMPEIAYRRAMSRELDLLGIRHACEVLVPILYKGAEVAIGRLDILVEDRLPLELKAIESLTAVHVGQLLSYLCMTKL
jgi:GxxExxY protein